MAKTSAGLLMYRMRDGALEVLLVHSGGPFWKRKDAGAWSIPKGEYEAGEDPLAAACREFQEETGVRPEGPFLTLGSARQKSGKVVEAWAFRGDCDPAAIRSNTFTMEWPPRSGVRREFPEVDRAEFFTPEAALRKINTGQAIFIDRLQSLVESAPASREQQRGGGETSPPEREVDGGR